MKTFSDLSLSALLKSNLAKQNFTELTPVQALAIEPALAGRDLVATAETGTGKTLAFVLPVIQALAKEPASAGIRSAIVVGGLSESAQLNAIRRGAQVAIATPGRLYDFLSRALVNLGNQQY